MSDETPPPGPQVPAPPPKSPPPGYYEHGAAPSAGWGAPPGEHAPETRWRDLRGLTQALTALFAIHIGLLALMVVGTIIHLVVLGDEEESGVIPTNEAVDRVNDAAALPAVTLLASFVVGIATLILLIIWLYRAAKNNEALGRQNPRLGPGWAIGGWFIPIAAWVIPFIVLDDVWRGSDPSVPRGDPSWRRSSTLGAIWAWLVTAVIFTIPTAVATSGGDVSPSDPEKVRRDDILSIIGALGGIAAAVFAIIVIRRVAARQEECLRVQQAAAASSAAS